jgi:hypothetical protein
MKQAILALVSMMVLGACGGADYCARNEECAKKAGVAYSVTDCRTKDQTFRELSNTKGCLTQYNEYGSCAAPLACGADVDVNCGAKYKALEKCLRP